LGGGGVVYIWLTATARHHINYWKHPRLKIIFASAFANRGSRKPPAFLTVATHLHTMRAIGVVLVFAFCLGAFREYHCVIGCQRCAPFARPPNISIILIWLPIPT
jgi:hypothetical protein